MHITVLSHYYAKATAKVLDLSRQVGYVPIFNKLFYSFYSCTHFNDLCKRNVPRYVRTVALLIVIFTITVTYGWNSYCSRNMVIVST